MLWLGNDFLALLEVFGDQPAGFGLIGRHAVAANEHLELAHGLKGMQRTQVRVTKRAGLGSRLSAQMACLHGGPLRRPAGCFLSVDLGHAVRVAQHRCTARIAGRCRPTFQLNCARAFRAAWKTAQVIGRGVKRVRIHSGPGIMEVDSLSAAHAAAR